MVSIYIKDRNRGIGTALFKETVKELLSKNKKTMIIWCLKENKNAINFYKKLGGVITESKQAKIGDKYYEEYGFFFDLKKLDNDNSF